MGVSQTPNPKALKALGMDGWIFFMEFEVVFAGDYVGVVFKNSQIVGSMKGQKDYGFEVMIMFKI